MLGKYLPPPWCPYKNDPNWTPGYGRQVGEPMPPESVAVAPEEDLKVQVEKLNLELAAQNQSKGYSLFLGLAGVAAKVFDSLVGGKKSKKAK